MSSRLKTKIFIIELSHKSGSLADLPGEFVEGQVPTVTLKNLLSIWAFSLPNIYIGMFFFCLHTCTCTIVCMGCRAKRAYCLGLQLLRVGSHK